MELEDQMARSAESAEREAALAAAIRILAGSLAAAVGPDETIDSGQLRDLLAGRLEPASESALFDRLGLPSAARRTLSALRYNKADRALAHRVALSMGPHPEVTAVTPLGLEPTPIYQLDGPHGGSGPPGDRGEPTFAADDRIELIARPTGPVSHLPPITLWVGQGRGATHPIEKATVQGDVSGVFRVLVPARRAFHAPGRWRLCLVIGEEMAPERAEFTESMVQMLRTWAIYAP